ncbi:MAG: hypothetical protein HKN93_02155, partial [Acidimicrobiia bacterium]|nr:hypothetical protein [Acidimicrobiia bacterium]
MPLLASTRLRSLIAVISAVVLIAGLALANAAPALAIGLDSDGDMLFDSDEIDIWGTDPFNPDTDGGGMWDGEEVNYWGTNPLDPFDDYFGDPCMID